MIAVALPWPNRSLSPNGRKHWRDLASAKKVAREYARCLTLSITTAAERAALQDAAAVSVTMTFSPPDRRRRDDDGMIGSMKAARDGIADAIGVDDHKWRVSYVIGQPVDGGRVLVEVHAA